MYIFLVLSLDLKSQSRYKNNKFQPLSQMFSQLGQQQHYLVPQFDSTLKYVAWITDFLS